MPARCSVRYTATIKSIDPAGADGKAIYNIEYTDESTHMINRPTSLDTLSSMPVPARRFVEFGHDELKLIWEPDVHITNLHQDMLTHEEVPPPPPMLSPPRLSSCPYHLKETKCPPLAPATSRVSRSAGSFPSEWSSTPPTSLLPSLLPLLLVFLHSE